MNLLLLALAGLATVVVFTVPSLPVPIAVSNGRDRGVVVQKRFAPEASARRTLVKVDSIVY